MAYIAPADLAAALPAVDETRLAEIIADAEAFAIAKAPGIKAAAFLADPERMAVVKAVLRAAIIYDATVTDSASEQPYGETTYARPVRSSVMLSPSQIETLRSISKGSVAVNGIYSLQIGVPDTLPLY